MNNFSCILYMRRKIMKQKHGWHVIPGNRWTSLIFCLSDNFELYEKLQLYARKKSAQMTNRSLIKA